MGTTYLIAKPDKRERFDLNKGPFFHICPEATVLFTFPGYYGTQEAFTLKVEAEFMDYFEPDADLLRHAREFAGRLWAWAGADVVSFMSEHDYDLWWDTHGDERLKETGSRWGDCSKDVVFDTPRTEPFQWVPDPDADAVLRKAITPETAQSMLDNGNAPTGAGLLNEDQSND